MVTYDDPDAAIMRRSVKEINFCGWEEKEKAAMEIKRLAKNDVKTRRLLADLGVISSLAAMLVESKIDSSRILAIEALIEMANGTFANKKLMVEAGLLSKIPHLMHTKSLVFDQKFAILLFSISSLAKTRYLFKSHHILPFIMKILNTNQTENELKLTCLATLHNLSTKFDNTKHITTTSKIRSLLISSTNKVTSELALSTLCNLILTSTGKKTIEDDLLVPEVFIEILSWDDKPKCQELATYLLMLLAHKSISQRKRMVDLHIVPVLLEVALLGSTLARKRALKLLQWFKEEKHMRIEVHSGPQERRYAMVSDPENDQENEQSRKDIKNMVKLSLDRNLESMIKRANGAEGCSGLKVLHGSSSSMSLPY